VQQPDPAAAAGLGPQRHARRGQRRDVAVDRALRHLQLPGQLGRRRLAQALEREQQGDEPGCTHPGIVPDPHTGHRCGVQRISSRQVYANAWMTVREDTVVREDGSRGIYGVVDKPTAAIVIPRDGDRLHLVEQFRYPVGKRRWEFPMGTAPDRAEVDPAELAARELAEETGLIAGHMEFLGDLDLAPGTSSQREHVYLATDLREGPVNREDSEQDMRTRWFTIAEFEDMVRRSEVVDAQTLAAYLLLVLRERGGLTAA